MGAESGMPVMEVEALSLVIDAGSTGTLPGSTAALQLREEPTFATSFVAGASASLPVLGGVIVERVLLLPFVLTSLDVKRDTLPSLQWSDARLQPRVTCSEGVYGSTNLSAGCAARTGRPSPHTGCFLVFAGVRTLVEIPEAPLRLLLDNAAVV
eukprot:scaffold2700_cov388-Prasinococcus_capsulatus_cf.AAC.5